MHVAIAGPIASEDVRQHLAADVGGLPRGYGGAPLLGTLIGELLARGHRVSAFTTSTDVEPARDRWTAAGDERFRIHFCGQRPRAFRPDGRGLGRAADFFRVERAALSRAIAAAQPDVVHAHWSYEFGLAALSSGLPHVVTCHDSPRAVLRYMPTMYRLARYFMARRCLAGARAVTAVSPYLRDEVARYCDVPVEVIPNPLPPRVLAQAGPAARVADVRPDRPPVVAMVINGWGRLKNPEAALRAFGALRRQLGEAELHLYGEGFGDHQVADAWSSAQGLRDGLRFFGRVPHARLLEGVGAADLLLHPSLLEGCPMGVAEAMALGVPVVGGVRSGGVPWVVGDGGLLVDVTDPQAMADAMHRLLSDRALRERHAQAAARRARETFAVGRVVDAYEAAYRRAIDACVGGAIGEAR
jgi:glycosyltransferase involved in cell wall biosynthesis